MIETEKLSKEFRTPRRTVLAVREVTFRCHPGQVYGLLGANGAGKTTILRLLATLLEPTSGSLRVAGFDARREPAAVRARIGFVSAGTALYGRLTAREMIEYFGRLNGMEGRALKERVAQVFERLEIDFADVRCDALSTGMKQKVSIARTLVHDPPVIIFDEPTLGLDVMTARTIAGFIRECRAEGKTVVFSTHVMGEAEQLCDTIGIVHQGRLLAEGSLGQLQTRYGQGQLEEIFLSAVAS